MNGRGIPVSKLLYPGTFDPITYGHLDLIKRAIRIFDRLIVAVGHNPQKKPLFAPDERVDMVRDVTRDYPQVEVIQFRGLLVHCAEKMGVYTIVRSLRSTMEYELELPMAVANRQLDSRFESIYMMPSVEYTYLNSTIVREIAEFGGDLTPFVSPQVAGKLRAKFPI